MLVYANGTYYRTTLHADEMMVERGITEYQIKETIENGTMRYGDSGQEIYSSSDLIVVVDDDRIITLFRKG